MRSYYYKIKELLTMTYQNDNILVQLRTYSPLKLVNFTLYALKGSIYV